MSNENHNDGPGDVPNSANDAADPLDLLFQKIDEHGLDHAEVKNLAQEHPELQEYLDFAREQEKEEPKKKQRALIVGTVFSGVLCAVVALVILGVYRNLQLPIVEKQLATARLSLEHSSSKATELESIVSKQAVDLKLYANAKEEIEKELASARLSLERSSSKATELERIVRKQEVDLKLYANAKEEIENAMRAREAAITAGKKADQALADSKKQVRSLEEARNTAVKALNQTDEALKLTLSNQVKLEKENVVLEKSRAKAVDDAKEAKQALEVVKLAFEKQKKEYVKLQNSSYLEALELAQLSKYRNLVVPKGKRLFENLASGKGTSAGSRYALAIRADIAKKDSEYKLLLREVVGQGNGNGPWENLALAELRGLSGDPRPIIELLTLLEEHLDRPPEGVPFAFLLLERDVAHQAAFRLHLKSKCPILKVLLENAKKGKQRDRVAAVATIGAFGPDAKDATPILIDLIDERSQQEPVTQWEAAMALGNIGPAADSSAKALITLSEFPRDPAISAAAFHALQRIIAPPKGKN